MKHRIASLLLVALATACGRDGTACFTGHEVGRGRAVAAGDLDGDGHPEVVVLESGRAQIYALGEGRTFEPRGALEVPASARALVLADFEGNGILDVAVASDEGLTTYLGKAGGGFGPRADVASTGTEVAMTAGDLDRDGFADVVLTALAGGASTVTFLFNRSQAGVTTASFAAPQRIAGRSQAVPSRVPMAFVRDEDRVPYVAFLNEAELVLLQSDATRESGLAFHIAAIAQLPWVGRGVAAGRLDGDPRPDFAVAGEGGAAVVLNLDEMNETAREVDGYAGPARAVGIADLDGDLDDDDLMLAGAELQLVVAGPEPRLSTVQPMPSPAASLAVADLDGDGLPDAVAAGEDGTVYALFADCRAD